MGEAATENSLMDDLAAAWDAQVDTEDQVDDTEVQQPESPDIPEQPDNTDSGPEEPTYRAEDAAVVPDGESQVSAPEDGDKPPVGLSAAAREVWKDVPEPVKKEFARIDQRMEGLAQKYGHDAQRAQQMDRTLAPYQQLFAMNGGAAQFMPNLLQTASLLQMGTPQQKAEMAANVIHQFGVDINMLDQALTGQAPQAPAQGQLTPEAVQQMVQQGIQGYQQQQVYQQQQRTTQEIQQELNEFAAQNEFYNDVRDEMATLFEIAARQGRDLTPKEAYDKACQLHPEISQIIQARQSQGNMKAKRSASSSIHGTPSGQGQSAPSDSTRAALEAAWDEAGRM